MKAKQGCQAQKGTTIIATHVLYSKSSEFIKQLCDIDRHLSCYSLITFLCSSEISFEDFQTWCMKTDCATSDISDTKCECTLWIMFKIPHTKLSYIYLSYGQHLIFLETTQLLAPVWFQCIEKTCMTTLQNLSFIEERKQHT